MVVSVYLDLALRIVAVVGPIAMYFLILGLLNSRRHPQILTGRVDFALLIGVLSPLMIVPLLSYLGASLIVALGCAAALAGIVALLAGREQSWVVYNLPTDEAMNTVQRAAETLGVPVRRRGCRLRIADRAVVTVTTFPLLQNVTVHMRGGDAELARDFQESLTRRLADVERDVTSPMAMGFLLAASAMFIAPMAFVVQQAPEIVRLLTGLLD